MMIDATWDEFHFWIITQI